MQNVTHVLTNEQSELRADTAEASRRRLNARANIGLDQVDNTSDADKPISSATQDALDSKMDVDNGTYLKSAEVSGNGYTLTIRPNNGDVIEFQGGGIVETVQADWAENSPSDPSFIKNKPDLSGYATTSAMDTALGQKQDTIDDLNTIRSGAAAGATAVQPSVLDDYATTSDLSTGLAGKQETIDDLSTIREGASAGATAVQPSALETAISGIRQVPVSESTDLNKVLTVNGSGTPVWAPAQGGGGGASVNDVTVNGTSVVDSNGVGVVIVPTKTSDLANDSDFVTSADIPTSTSDLNNDSGFITSTDIPVTDVKIGNTSVVNNQGVAEIPDMSGFATTSAMNTALAGKQDTISDLSDIRAGAGLGATAVQPSTLSSVATSGNYEDLTNKPTIPTVPVQDVTVNGTSVLDNGTAAVVIPAQVQADWESSSGLSEILHKPDLSAYATTSALNNALAGKQDTINDLSDIRSGATAGATAVQPGDLAIVATSGSYNSLIDKPSIPSNTSDLTNDSGYITSSDIPAQSQADWTEADNSKPSFIKNKPTIPSVPVTDVTVNGSSVVNNGTAAVVVPTQVQADWNSSSGLSEILHKPDLSVYATTSAMNTALAGKQDTISNLSTIEAGAAAGATAVQPGELATVATSGQYSDLTGTPTIPTKTSDLTNDSSFITLSDVPAQAQADWTESDNTKASFVKNKPSNLVQDANYVHTDNNYDNAAVTKLGTIESGAQVNVQADWNQTDSNADDYIKNRPTIPAAQVNADWNSTTGVSKILNKPSIPTNTSDLNNDSGFITVSDIPAQVQADWTETDNTKASFVKNKPSLATVATSGSYTDLSNKPTIPSVPVQDVTVNGTSVVSNGTAAVVVPAQVQADWTESDNTKASFVKNKPTLATVATSGSYGDLSNAPTLASVATSGDYDDLTNKPTIPAAQVNSDWDAVSGVAQILNKPSLSTVATTGSYDDLIDKPTIPTVPVTDVTVNGSSVVSNGTAAVVVPAQAQADWTETDNTKASFVKNKPSLATVATSGSYTDLSNTPAIPTVPVTDVTVDGTSVLSNGTAAVVIPVKDVTVGGTSVVTNQGVAAITIPSQIQADWTEADTSDPSYIANKPSLATVATTGSYSDLSNTPTLATVATTGSYDDLIDKPTIPTVPVTDVTVNGSSVVSNGTAAVVVPAQVQADWTESDNTKPSFVKNKPSLATVATTGSYTDLSNTPTIPSVPVTDVTVDGTSVLSNGTAAVVIPVKDVTVGGSSVVTNQGVAAITIPTQVQADWAESDNSDPSFIANKPDLAVKADKVTSATSGDFASLDSNGNLTDSGVSANSFKTVQNAVTDPTENGTATSFIDSISQNSNGVITATKKTIPADLVSRTVYVGQDCVYNDKEFWDNASTVADVINDYANQTVTDYRGNSVSLVRFQAEYDSNRFRIAAIDETPGTVDYNRKIGGQIVDLIRCDFGMTSLPNYNERMLNTDFSIIFESLLQGSPKDAYVYLYDAKLSDFLTLAKKTQYLDMIRAYDAWPYVNKDTAYDNYLMANSYEYRLSLFTPVATSWPTNSWTSTRYLMAGTKDTSDKVVLLMRHAERGSDTSVNGDINSEGVSTLTSIGQQNQDGKNWSSGGASYTIDNFPANDTTYYSTEYLRCRHSAQLLAEKRLDTNFAASDFSGVTVLADMLTRYRFFKQPASSGNSSLIRTYVSNPSNLTSTQLTENFGVSSAAEAQAKLAADYDRICREILDKSTARLNTFFTHDFFTLPMAYCASNGYFDFSGNSSIDNRNWINYCAGVGMVLHADKTFEVMPIRGKSEGSMTI